MDNWVIFLIVFLAYFDIKATLRKILNTQTKNTKKDFSLLEKLKEKEVQIETDNEDINMLETTRKGILKDFNDVWLILEINTKKRKELMYYRIKDIKGVVEIKN